MTAFIASSTEEGHFVCRDGTPHGPPYPSLAAAARISDLANTRRRRLLVVERIGHTRGCWHALVRQFTDRDGEAGSAVAQLLAWWQSLGEETYIRARAHARVYDITDRDCDLLAGSDDAPRILTDQEGSPADPLVELTFAPATVRTRVRLAGHPDSGQDVTDDAMTRAAGSVIARDQHLWQVIDELDREIVRVAALIQTQSSR